MENKENKIINDVPPLDKNGKPKVKFEVKQKELERAIFIDGRKIELKVDQKRLKDASDAGPEHFQKLQLEIQEKFIKTVAEALGRRVSIFEIQRAIMTGWI